jgi:toxin ParE1/3/4
MPKIFIRPAAETDLIDIWIYIARDNPAAADRVYHAAEETFKALSAMPGVGTPYHSKRAGLRGLRFFLLTKFPHYVIYYREIKEGIEIIRVLHGHMDRLRKLALEE